MASKATNDEAVVCGDEFLADEILARLPARCAARCTMLSKRFRQLLRSPHFCLRHRRLSAPLELPHAARLQRHTDGNALYAQFHVVGPTFVIEHTVQVEHGRWDASTCNGLVLVSCSCTDKEQSSVHGVVFNPATKEEARLSLQLPHPGKEGYHGRQILGFGYGPSSKVYKALIREVDDNSARLMVVSLDGSSGQEPRTVFSSNDDMDCNKTLYTDDGKVYLLIYYTINNLNLFENEDMSVLAFDVDCEVVARIAIPEGHEISTRMLVVHGRPCIYAQEGQDTLLWLLTADHRWEQLYILVTESYDYLEGAWDCGGGLLFAEFDYSGAYMYNLHEAVREKKESSGGNRLAAVSSLKIDYKWPKYNCPENMWDYQPTLISPASIFGDAAFSGRGRESVAPNHELDGTFPEMTQKWIVDPMKHMLSILPRSD